MADYSELFLQDSTDKQMTITSDNGVVITNTELHGDEFELHESLCSEKQLKFGSCESASIKFKISYVRTSLKDHWLTVKVKIGENDPYQYGVYKVTSDVPTADREFREVEAYDALHDIIMSDVADWYNTILPNENSTVTLKQFRDSFFNHFGITQETINLPQDNMTVEKTIEPSEISGKDVVTAICEINGCFGHIGRDGKFKYVFIGDYTEGLYPRNDLYPANDLYPVDATGSTKIERQHYISAEYEDFTVKRINKLQVRQSENDIGAIIGTGDNCYIVEDNFLVYGKSANELNTIAQTLYVELIKVHYRPVKMQMKGNPTFLVGDSIRLNTKYEIIYTYILERTLKGIQALYDEIDAQGEEYYNQNLNSVNKSIVQLRGKTNELTRTVEETNSRITNVQAGLQTQITQNAESISAEATRAGNAENSLSSRITLTAEGLSTEITRAQGAESALSNSISATAEGLSIEITRAQGAESNLQNDVDSKVGNSEVITKINASAEQVQINTPRMNLTTNGWNILANGDFELGGVGNNAALSYAAGTNFIALRNGLSLKLNGISLLGDRYKFDVNGAYKYNEETGVWDTLSLSDYVYGRITFDATGSYYVSVVQFPNMTIVDAKFSLTAAGASTVLLSNILPIHSLPITTADKSTPITIHNASDWFVTSGVNYGYVHHGSIASIHDVTRYTASDIETVGILSGSSGGKQYIFDTIVYPSLCYPLSDLLEIGYIDV